MSLNKLKSLVLASALTLPFGAYAEGQYDGIYATTPDVGFAMFRENQGSMVGVLNQTDILNTWLAGAGVLKGSSVRLSTVVGLVDQVIDVTFTSPTSFNAKMVSCKPKNRSVVCLFKDGSTFTGRKIF